MRIYQHPSTKRASVLETRFSASHPFERLFSNCRRRRLNPNRSGLVCDPSRHLVNVFDGDAVDLGNFLARFVFRREARNSFC